LIGLLTRHVEPNFTLFGYMIGFIVAVYSFREMFPNIPPFVEVWVDDLSFYWAVPIAAITACVQNPNLSLIPKAALCSLVDTACYST
jgi:hypothetical protein